ncbi:hypothetical protein ON010_g437 [Phytophthora cinnamomi]|nr:hypothetical protein ON010_g437 [Phytophthora cinnamomi]
MASSIPKPRASLTAAQGSPPVMRVPLGSRVVLSRRRNGTVRYVGKLANESGEWYGVALDEPKGDTDGTRGKERYFHCPTNHGVFVRRKEIYCVKEPGNILKGPPSPITDDSSSCSSSASTDQLGDLTTGMGVVHSTNSDIPASPLMKTFKGFRKQLDFISLRTVGPGRSREASPVTSPASSTPSSPSAKSGLKPPSPFRRFSSFTHELPSPGSPTSKLAPSDTRRQSAIPLSPKPSAVRRISSFREPGSHPIDDSIRPVGSASPVSPTRFSSFQQPASTSYSRNEDASVGAANEDDKSPSLAAVPAELSPLVDGSINVWPAASGTEAVVDSMLATPTVAVDKQDDDLHDIKGSTSLSSRPADTLTAATIEDSTVEDNISVEADAISSSYQTDIASVENSTAEEMCFTKALNKQSNVPLEQPDANSEADAPARFTFRRIDISAIPRLGDFNAVKRSPAASPRDSTSGCARCSHHSSPTDAKLDGSQMSSTERTRSFRLGRSSSFRVPGSPEVSPRRSPASSSENSPSRRSKSLSLLSFDHVDTFDDDSEDGQGSPVGSIAPSPRDDISEASAASAPESRVKGLSLQRSPRCREELTAIESLSPDKKLVEADNGSGDRPLFFRRTNVGRSPMERRSSYSSFSTSSSSSPPKSPTSNSATNAASRSSRVAELEREIAAMRSSHENIVAVLRATNKQHAANVLELRAQVAALTEGNLWLERQLTAKGELVRELREMEKQQQRDTVSVSEVEKILEIKDGQIQTLEREIAQLRQRLARLESDKDSQLYQQFRHYEARRERDEKRVNELRKEVLAMVRPCVDCDRASSDPSRLTHEMLCASQCNERLELQSEVRDLKEMSLRFF